METFREAFASRIWPIIKQTFEQWKALDVVKQDDGAIGEHFGVTKVLDACAKNGECRNQACNAAKAARTKEAVASAKGLLWVNPQGAGTTTKVAQRAMTFLIIEYECGENLQRPFMMV